MRRLLIAWPLQVARRAAHALRNAATRFAASADRAVTIQPTDEAADPEGNEAARAKQKSEYLKLFASAGF